MLLRDAVLTGGGEGIVLATEGDMELSSRSIA